MPFIGNQPALSYTSFAKQDFTTSATTSYTLDNPVANANELALFINFVRQEPGSYSASGTTLTLTEATSSSDDMYAIFLGKAIQTVNPPNNSVNEAQLNYPLTTFSSTGIDDNATSTAVTIDSNENVGIGTSSPISDARLTVSSDNSESFIFFERSGSTRFDSAIGMSSSSIVFKGGVNSSTVSGLNEFMRIDDSGNVLIGTTSVPNSSEANNSLCVAPTLVNSTQTLMQMENNLNTTATSKSYIDIYNGNGTQVGSISANQSATQYNTSSDYRLKENVSYDFDATTRLKQLKPARFNFIADANTTVDGFLAHEVSSVVPEAISGEKDAMRTEEYEVTPAVLDEDGNVITEAVMGTREVPDYQGIDQAKLVPLLVKTIQELEARITELENK